MKPSYFILSAILFFPFAGCRTAPDYALDAEVQNQKAKEARAVDDMKGALIKPTMDSQETDAGRLRTAK